MSKYQLGLKYIIKNHKFFLLSFTAIFLYKFLIKISSSDKNISR